MGTSLETASKREANSKLLAVNTPFEVLAMIFELACCLDEFTMLISTSPRKRTIHPHDTRQAINLTCFRWRETAIWVSPLWNHIIFADRCHMARRSGLDFIPTEIERSAGRPLAAHVITDVSTIDAFNSFCSTPLITASLGSLYLARIPGLSRLQSPHSVAPLCFLDAMNRGEHWPKLRSLRVYLRGLHKEDRQSSDTFLDLTQATSLTDVRLRFETLSDLTLKINPPLHCSIRRLDIFDQIEVSSMLNLLRVCKHSLETFVWSHQGGEVDGPLPTNTFPQLLKLDTLRLDGTEALIHISQLSTCAPNVTHLHLGELDFGEEGTHMITRDAVGRIDTSTFPKLEYLNQCLPFSAFESLVKGSKKFRSLELHHNGNGVLGTLRAVGLMRLDQEVATTLAEHENKLENKTLELGFGLESLETLHMDVPLPTNTTKSTVDVSRIERLMETRKLVREGARAASGSESNSGFCLILDPKPPRSRRGTSHELYELAKKYQGRFRIECREHTEDLGESM